MQTYCVTHKILTDDRITTTHTFMDGSGKIKLSSENSHAFWKSYISHIKHGMPISLAERSNSSNTRFFIDIDLKTDIFDMEAFVHRCNETHRGAVYYICNRKRCDQLFGVHIIFHSISYKTVEEAEKIAETFFWVPGLDTSVYSSGLRMIGSVKPGQELNEESIYLPEFKITGTNVRRVSRTISLKSIAETSIRLTFQNRIDNSVKKQKRVNLTASELIIPETLSISEEYDDCITNIYEYKDGYYIANTNSRFCTNIQQDHNSVFVYFVIHPKTRIMYQKCFCRCANKTCASYKSKSVKLSIKSRDLILLH